MFYLFNRKLFVEIESKEGRKTVYSRHKQLQQMTACRKFRKWNTGFADSKKKKNLMPTDPKHTYYFFDLTVTWTVENKWI